VKPSETPPNIATDLEKKDGTPLSDEAANRYRRILGRIAWWAQARVDYARSISMLSVGQAIPTEFHEAAMRRCLRFLRSCCHFSQAFPSEGFRPLGVQKRPLLRLHSLDGNICCYFDVVDDGGGGVAATVETLHMNKKTYVTHPKKVHSD